MWKKTAKAALFLIIFLALFAGVSKVMNHPGDNRNYQWIAGFYDEPEGSLDAVYIGSSTCYAYWNPLTAWEEHGIAVYPFTSNAQHFITTEYLIREARKTQPDALYIVNTNTIDSERMEVEKFHFLLDYMPFSVNKLRLTKYLCDTAGFSAKESLELYVPLYRYHVRWSDLNRSNFTMPLNGLKGASHYSIYWDDVIDLTELYNSADGRSPLPDYIADAAVRLMDYCEREGVRILFVTVPRVETEERIRELNELNAMLKARGFDTLELLDRTDELQLDLTQDFYNEGHTNIHGSLKYTDYLSEYIMERFGITDKRGDPRYSSWDDGYKAYEQELRTYSLDLESDLHHRDNTIARPSSLEAAEEAGSIVLAWTSSERADGYLVYRRQAGKPWEALGEATETCYTDLTAEMGKKYDYTVVPYREADGGRVFGNFDYHGISVHVQAAS